MLDLKKFKTLVVHCHSITDDKTTF